MIYVISGNNDLQRSLAIKKFTLDFVAKHGDFSVEHANLENLNYPEIISLVSSLPFLVERKLIVLEEPGLIKEFTESFDEFMEVTNDSIDVLIYEPKIDKRSSYFKKLKKLPNFSEYSVLSESDLLKWMGSYAKSLGGSISMSNSVKLMRRVGANQMMLKNELDKLFLYNPEISSGSIELLSDEKPTSTIFNLLDSALRGDKKKTLEIYNEQKKLRIDAMQILAMLTWQLHILCIIKTAKDRSTSMIAADSKLKPFNIDSGSRLLNRISLEQLKIIINRTLDLDTKFKTRNINLDDALTLLLVTLDS